MTKIRNKMRMARVTPTTAAMGMGSGNRRFIKEEIIENSRTLETQ